MLSEVHENEVVRRYAKYVFLDVVKFSKRSAEAQSDIVSQLNSIVRSALETLQIRDEDIILIPTGDGMCIALISPQLPFDIHIQVSLNILEAVETYNQSITDATRQFQVRIGINQNTDILITDINSRRNVAGAGINTASRIMDKADGNQILVSHTVYDELQPSERYMDNFRSFDAKGKHEQRFRVYQYIGEFAGLNSATPSEFEVKSAIESKLTKEHAYYMAHAIGLKQFIVQKQGHGQNEYSLTVMLWFLAKDSVGEAEATEITPYQPKIYGDGKASLEEVFQHYQSLDFQVISRLALFIYFTELRTHQYCFVERFGSMPLFVTDSGKQKLKNEWLSIWNEMQLDNVA